MNKLWVRLSLAFAGVVLIAVFIVIATGIVISQADRFVDFHDELEAPGGLVEELTAHYRSRQSWKDVEPLLIGARTTFRGRPYSGLIFFLADGQKKIIYHPQPRTVGKPMGQVPQSQVLPIRVDGRTVGYLGVGPPFVNRPGEPGPPFANRPGQPRPPFGFLSGLLLTIAVVGGVVGIVFGILVSRTVTAPLNRLAESARAIGRRDLSRRVEVKGSDELQDVAQAFNEMAADLEQAEQLRRNLLADIAHELRTPLTVVQGNLRAMLDEVYDLDKTEVARLYEQTRLLSRLVNDLHELAQAEARQLPLNLQETDLIQLITTVSDIFAPIAGSKNVTVRTDLPPNLPLIGLDEARLTQVLHNILNNGLRHTPEGGTITISATREPTDIRIDISDTGEGIPPEHLPHIFDRFYRADPARSRDRGGAGLGLAIARAIVEAHGGQVSVTSDGAPGQGATFTIHLPLDN